jgi:FkbM family methyltransferase
MHWDGDREYDPALKHGAPTRNRKQNRSHNSHNLRSQLQIKFVALLKVLRNQFVTGSWPVQTVVRALYPIGTTCTVHRGPLKGLRFRVTQGMGFTYAWGIGVEQWNFDGLVQPGMCVYDVGANSGQSTLALARAVGTFGRVVAFEPVDSVFANLVANLQLNPSLQVTPVCAAAYERRGSLEFLFRRDEVTQGRLADVEPTYAVINAETIIVRAVRLDDYSTESWPVPQLLKIDVEGGGGAVLRGAQNLIAQYRPVIYIELHGPEEQKAVRELLMSLRYKAHAMSGQEVEDPTTGWASPLVCMPV